MSPRKLNLISWSAQILAAIIMGQTLFYKFTAHPDSVQLFAELGAEPFGRLLTGLFELIACVLLLIPSKAVYGAILGCALMAGAIASHIAKLGWQGPRLELGLLAVVVLVCCLIVIALRRNELPLLKKR